MISEKPQFVETLKERTTLFQAGDQQVIWGIPLNTIDVDAHEVDEYLADGWYAHPFGVRDAQEAEQLRLEQEALEAQRIKDEQTTEEAERQRKSQESIDEQARLKLVADEAAKSDNDLKAKLIEEAEGLGLTIDKRWGTKTLQEAIDEAKKDK